MALNNNEKNIIKNNIITPLAKTNLLAMYYQKWHYRSINLVYYFSAGAVAIVALQLLFFPEFPQILFFEALMMITIILLYLLIKTEIGIGNGLITDTWPKGYEQLTYLQ